MVKTQSKDNRLKQDQWMPNPTIIILNKNGENKPQEQQA